MNSYEDILRKLIAAAEASDAIKAMVLFGSRARVKNAADEYSDYDIIFLVKDIDYFIHTDDWLKEISPYYISFWEPTVAGGKERRVMFDQSMDMDFLFLDVNKQETIGSDEIILSFFSQGYRILVDKVDFARTIERNKPFPVADNMMSEEEYTNLVNNFWFHTIWSVKKLLRGELWAGKKCIDGYMKDLLRQMLECYGKAFSGADYEEWHDGRFFDQRIAPEVALKLTTAYATYEVSDALRALLETMDLFKSISRQTASLLNYDYPNIAEDYACDQVRKFMDR